MHTLIFSTAARRSRITSSAPHPQDRIPSPSERPSTPLVRCAPLRVITAVDFPVMVLMNNSWADFQRPNDPWTPNGCAKLACTSMVR